jgi:hypothetical protein
VVTRLAICVALITTFTVQSRAAASDSDYCNKVRARAGGDAALLFAPSLIVQALRYPFGAELGPNPNPVIGDNVQLRAGLSFSPVDMFRGLKIINVGDADCEAFESRKNIERLLTDASDASTLLAYRAQIAYLEEHRSQREKLLEQAQRRLERRIITVVEFEAFFRRAETLEFKVEELRESAERINARGVRPSHFGIDRLEAVYLDNDAELERRMSSVKSLDAWTFRIVGGGMAYPNQRYGWFGTAEVGYNLGGLFRTHKETQYLKARRAEVQSASYEYPAKLKVLRKQVESRLDQARRELALIERHLTVLERAKAALDAANTPMAAHEQNIIVFEQLMAESDRMFWSTLIAELNDFIRRWNG